MTPQTPDRAPNARQGRTRIMTARRSANRVAAATSAERAHRQSCRALLGPIQTFPTCRAPRRVPSVQWAALAASARRLTRRARLAHSRPASASLSAPPARRAAIKMRRDRRSASRAWLVPFVRSQLRHPCRARRAATAIGPTSNAPQIAHAPMWATLAKRAAPCRLDALQGRSRRHPDLAPVCRARRASIKTRRGQCPAFPASMGITALSVPLHLCHAQAAPSDAKASS